MNKTELIAGIAEVAGLTKVDSEKAIDAIIVAITNALREGDQVKLLGFGTFCAVERAATTGRNPKTGEPMEIPAMTIPKFKAGQQLKDALKN
jgi:DNA-binding protein HU-beta